VHPRNQSQKARRRKQATRTRDVRTFSTENPYTIPIRHFIGLAKAVVSSTNPKIVVSSSIFTLLCDVISLRKEVSPVLGQAAMPGDGRSGGHSQFINILERVKETLRPSTEKAGIKNEDTPETPEQWLGNYIRSLRARGILGCNRKQPCASTSKVLSKGFAQANLRHRTHTW
jgi:hypothetical protein